MDLPYEFTVKEGEARKLIGRIHAEDADEGINAEITYFAPDDIPFTVDPETGDVLTKIVLDYEQNDVSVCLILSLWLLFTNGIFIIFFLFMYYLRKIKKSTNYLLNILPEG